MQMKHIFSKYKRVWMILLVVGMGILFRYQMTNPDNYIKEIKRGYEGVIIDKYIPDMIRNDHRWPAEWKDKWLQSK
ncbi:hypothetical protein GCM10011511_07490 [Puia dinghuensis]|uniref:Uncharacterized protein n=1 Tax=Puia dinghuensis TaxID=1792502 RepID=A0A8J2U8T5_9BACT|nr:hypothetical protein GCM10011511_07490 [Puia dinghuensis]